MSENPQRPRSPIDRMVDQACGFDPNNPPAPPNRQPPDEAADLLLKMADGAEAWWRSHRPKGWSKKKHIANPTVNITSEKLWPLARAVARWKEIGG